MRDDISCREKYKRITETLIRENIQITTMESCTAGLIISLLADTEGASAVIKGAYVTYSNVAKLMCGVPQEVINTYGVYSQQTARAMARACIKAFNADIGIGITGSFANVDPANEDSVPGEIYFSIIYDKVYDFHIEKLCEKDRHAAKMTVAECAADELLSILRQRRKDA